VLDFEDAVKGRRSIRSFLPENIPEEDIQKIISLATCAPSAGNYQDWRFKVVINKQVKSKMKEIVQSKLYFLAKQADKKNPESFRERKTSYLFADAPVALVVQTKLYRGALDELMIQCGYKEAEIDYLRMRPDLQTIGALIQTALLAAHSLGYGTCWLAAPNCARHELENLLEIRPPWSIAAIVAIGRPNESKSSKQKIDIDKITEIIY